MSHNKKPTSGGDTEDHMPLFTNRMVRITASLRKRVSENRGRFFERDPVLG
jgi:hypothetical protein